ncbi:MAG: apolipoprotein N-acyltransferase [Rhodospirillales bacterium]|nr:apolipoprotein N-acyltransferase [Rhodospirillales bacterium]
MNASSATRSTSHHRRRRNWLGPAVTWLRGLRGLRADGIALAAGLLAAFALPPYGVLPVLLVAFPVLMVLLEVTPRALVAARRGWWFGFGLHLVGLYWITDAIMIEAARFWWLVPLAVPALAAVLAVFVGAATGVARLAPPGWRRMLALAGAWVLADLARQFVGTGFPWNPLGSVWELPGRVGDVMIQPAAYVGVHGLTLATVLLACTPLAGRVGWMVLGGALAAWIGVGSWRLSTPMPLPGVPLKVLLVQGNVPQGAKWDMAKRLEIFRRYLHLTDDAVRALPADDPAVVVWPETASPFLLDGDAEARDAIEAATHGAPALVGAVRFGADGRPRNTLFALTEGEGIAGRYDKWHLVPFGEYQPSWFPLGIQVVPGGGFAAGSGPTVMRVPRLPPFGPLICYEAIFSGQVTGAAGRPEWLVNITNDAWFGDSSGPRQHLAAARMRAVEEGLPLMRAANTGISAGFDGYGRELGRLHMNVTGVLNVALPPALQPTVYSRFGLFIPLVVSLFVLGIAWFGRRTVRKG